VSEIGDEGFMFRIWELVLQMWFQILYY